MERISADLSDALRLLTQYCEQRGIKLALVGALVPAVFLSGLENSMRIGNRETTDLDSVVRLDSWQEWETLIAEFVQLGFQQGRGEEEHRLYYRTAQIDLIPYGAMVSPEGVLTWPASGSQMNMIGISDVFAHAHPIEIVPGITMPVAPLWSFVVMKIAAYEDRKFPRDLTDLVHVMDEYERFTTKSRRYDVLGQRKEINFETAGAYLLSQDIKANARSEAVRLARGFLQGIDSEYHKVVGTVLREEKRSFSDSRRAYVYDLFTALRLGLE